MAEAVRRLALTAQAWARFQLSPCEICGVKKVTLGQGLLPALQFVPLSTIPPVLRTHSCIIDATHCLRQLIKRYKNECI